MNENEAVNPFLMFLPLITIILLIAVPSIIVAILRNKYPKKIWLGILLSIIFNPIGQFYLEKAIIYVLILFVFFSLATALTASPFLSWLFVDILSAMLMYYRLFKIKK